MEWAIRRSHSDHGAAAVIFTETSMPGAWLVEPEPLRDERGWFARTFDAAEFRARGLDDRVVQESVSYNARAGTLRGLHYQASPHEEAKLVRCARGAIFDVIVDLRRGSPTHRRWFSVELDARTGRMLYVPEGLAHGFQTLMDDTEVHYRMNREYAPEHARGVRWDDPDLGIEWPEAERTISERDQGLPLLEDR
jgi:dTDP-4-dehydrorhamnose 3,5-epimerase